MEPLERRRRFTQARVARLATVGADGTPHLVPLVFVLVGDVVYSSVDSKPKSTRRLRRLDNIAATGRVSLLVDAYDEDWARLWWVRADGVGEILPADGDEGALAIAALTGKYHQYDAVPPAGPVIAVRVERWRAWSAAPDGTERSGEGDVDERG